MHYEVAIQVITYNQKDYIAQCLDSIVMQRTTFPFVAIVHDDSSTDGTADIVRQYAGRYPDIIRPIFQTENQYSKGFSPAKIAAEELDRLNPKYKCILDGDDYWTDAESLQMRYDYLETHPECAVVYSKVVQLLPSGEIAELDAGYKWEVPTFEQLLMRNNVPLCTAMFRLDIFREYLAQVKPFDRNWPINDWAMWLYMTSKHYEMAFIDRVTCVYRVTPVSITRRKTLRGRIKYINGIKHLSLYFSRYSTQPHIRRQIKRRVNRGIYNEIMDEIKKYPMGALLFKVYMTLRYGKNKTE